MPKSTKKVLLIGWDAADWKMIHPLMDEGRMPYLQRLVEGGSSGNICTLHPVLSPMLWTSIATGKRPYQHGILGFFEPTPDGSTIQPMTNLSRKCKAVWNILNQNEKRSIVLGWWPSQPAEPIDGVMVSDLFFKSSMRSGFAASAPKLSVIPEELTKEMEELRLDPRDITGDEIRAFIPLAEQVDQKKDPRLAQCAKVLAECTSVQNIATHLVETQEWDFMAVYFDAIDHFCHGFMKYHPPRRPFIKEKDFELYKDIVAMGYAYHDLMLGRLLQLAGDDVTVIVMSDHGFHPDHLRPDYVPYEPAGPAIEHRDLGIFVINGPGIKKDHLLFGLNLLDVTPTILALFGLPVGKDMDGRVIRDAFEVPLRVKTIPSWEKIDGRDGRHPEDMELDAGESKQALQQLVDLGYVESLADDDDENIERSKLELNFNLARAYIDANRHADAIPLLVEALKKYPSEYRIGIQLAMCYRRLERINDLRQLVTQLRERRINEAKIAQEKAQRYNEILRERTAALSEGSSPVMEEFEGPQPDEAGENGDVSPNINSIFNKEEQLEFRRYQALAQLNPYALEFLAGYAALASGDTEAGLESLQRAILQEPRKPGLYVLVGDAFLMAEKWDGAIASFEKALELDENNPQALLGLAECWMHRKKPRRAAEYARQSIGRLFHNPRAHFALGSALYRLKQVGKAIESLERAVEQNPNYRQAHQRLAFIHKKEGNQEASDEHARWARMAAKASRLQQQERDDWKAPEIPTTILDDKPILPDRYAAMIANEDDLMLPTLKQAPRRTVRQNLSLMKDQPFVTIVTGLPRSGTSMMMQMLSAGGIPALTDNRRVADEDNPRGYLELDVTKRLANENRWVLDANRRSLKVIVQLLEYLPRDMHYKFIFMLRDIGEIVESQRKMLDRNQAEGGNITPEKLSSVFNRQVGQAQQLIHEKGVPTMAFRYHRIVSAPRLASNSLQQFLGVELDIDEMVRCVDKTLYRTKVQPAEEQ